MSYSLLKDFKRSRKTVSMNSSNEKNFQIQKLSSKLIHVAGTKGKGSTCALTESIIRNHGFKTGLFTSPHLISIRERIKINGKLISEELFSHYFFQCYDTLSPLWENDESMRPGYFKFLTLLAMKVFEGENVDCCVLEVGIGGRTDPTNIYPSKVCSGITTLDYDHMDVLGSTLAEIAYEKAGIIKSFPFELLTLDVLNLKPRCPIVTVDQEEEAQPVIIKKARDENSPIFITSHWDSYAKGKKILGEFQKKNASLACALANIWLNNKQGIMPQNKNNNNNASSFSSLQCYDVFELNEKYEKGIAECFWPGRAQIIEKGKTRFLLDGAHTPISIHSCLEWFEDEMKNLQGIRILCFNCKSSKDYEKLLSCIESHASKLPFDYIFFTPSRIKSYEEKNSDKSNFLSYDFTKPIAGPIGDQTQVKYRDAYERIKSKDTEFHTKLEVFEFVDSAIERIETIQMENNSESVHVLVTGSLYVVGAYLEVLGFNTDFDYSTFQNNNNNNNNNNI